MSTVELPALTSPEFTSPVAVPLVAVPLTTLGGYAHQVVQQYCQHLLKLEKKVLADRDPENLHEMRVNARRLWAALQVFGRALWLPKTASQERLQTLIRALGKLRDLDVQIAELKQTYVPRLQDWEQTSLKKVIKALRKARPQAFAKAKTALGSSQYQNWQQTWQTWLAEPMYTSIAQQPLPDCLPYLLSPLLSELLLHPGWMIAINNLSDANSPILHDLRKACKHVRYQTEFFLDFYDEAFGTWVKEVKSLQDSLGKLHDSQVLLDLLGKTLPKGTTLPGLQAIIQAEQMVAMADWERLRHQYLNPKFRSHLFSLLVTATQPV